MIVRIEVFPLAWNEPHYRGMERCVTLVRIETEDGIVGWGEAISQFREATLATCILVRDGFTPLITGESPLDVERLWHKMCQHAYWYGVEGIAAFAISAIDMALWDLKGKLLGQPIAKLLGGQQRDRVPVIPSFILDMEDLDWTLAEFAGLVDEGYGIVKAGWGMHPDAVFGMDRKRDLTYVKETRRVIGDDISLVLDTPGARGLWDVATAIQRIREFEPYDLRWIEQPLVPANLEGHARLRRATSVPIGTGEDEWSPETYKRVIDAGAADVIQLDPGRCLGLTGCREVIKMVEAANLRYSAHSWSTALSTAASVQILAISPSSDGCDFKPHDAPLKEDLVENPWRPKDGFFAVPHEPGLGMRVREDVVSQYVFG